MINTVIWDLDGCVSDTQKIHAKVESELLARYGIDISPDDITARYAGVRDADFFRELLDKKKAEYDLKEVLKEKHKKMAELAEKGVDPMPGSVALIKKLSEQGFKQAVASSSYSEYVNVVLNSLGIRSIFNAVVCGDQVEKGKPDPECFLLAAKKLESNPGSCVVIEDAKSGMLAARAAGMKCIALVPDTSLDYPADVKVSSLEAMDVDGVRKCSA